MPIDRNRNNQIKIVHLGSIYGNRNLDNWFRALDELYSLKLLEPGKLQIVNIGMSNSANSENYLRRKDYKLIEAQPRILALEMATSADYLLLLQHTDDRSRETIPYKLYDYLNLGIPIIALISNSEINDILLNKNESLVADVNDIKSIQELIMQLKISDHPKDRSDLKSKQFGENFLSIFL